MGGMRKEILWPGCTDREVGRYMREKDWEKGGDGGQMRNERKEIYICVRCLNVQ